MQTNFRAAIPRKHCQGSRPVWTSHPKFTQDTKTIHGVLLSAAHTCAHRDTAKHNKVQRHFFSKGKEPDLPLSSNLTPAVTCPAIESAQPVARCMPSPLVLPWTRTRTVGKSPSPSPSTPTGSPHLGTGIPGGGRGLAVPPEPRGLLCLWPSLEVLGGGPLPLTIRPDWTHHCQFP